MTPELVGIYPPITTPFTESEDIDLPHLKQNLDHWNKFEFTGVVVLGSNGEFPFLSREEKIQIVRAVKMSMAPEKQIIVGAGCEGTNETINLCNSLWEIGANAALIYTPHFFRNQMTDDALIHHYKEVADHSKLPIILYNVPSNTGIELNFEVASRLSGHSNIIGLKDSGGNIKKLEDVVKATKNNNFRVLAGSAGFLADAMEVGCVGGICALANVLPEKTIQIFELMRSGRIAEAKVLQGQIHGPNNSVTRKYGVPALKYIMDKFGFHGGPVRSPLLPLSSNEKQEIDKEFASFHSKITF